MIVLEVAADFSAEEQLRKIEGLIYYSYVLLGRCLSIYHRYYFRVRPCANIEDAFVARFLFYRNTAVLGNYNFLEDFPK